MQQLIERMAGMDYSELKDISSRLGDTGGLEDVIARAAGLDYSSLTNIAEQLGDTSSIAELARAARDGDFTQLNEIIGLLGDSPELRGVLANTANIDMSQMDNLINRATNVEGFDRISGQLEDVSELESIAGTLLSREDVADLRKSAMTTLEGSSEALNAMLAQQGIRGSGFAAQQQRQLASEVMGGLASDISRQRTEALGTAAGVLGQAAGQRGLAANVLGTAGQQTLGAGALAGQRVGAEQQTLGLQADIARGIGSERAAAGGLAAQRGSLEQAGIGLSGQMLDQMARQLGMSSNVLAQQLGLEQSGLGLEMSGLDQMARQLGMSSQALAQQLGLEQSGMGMEANAMAQMAQQLGMSGDQLARALGLEQQGVGLQMDALQRAMSGEQAISQMEMQRISEIGRLFQDEAFGADLDYNPFELEAEYNAMDEEQKRKVNEQLQSQGVSGGIRGLLGNLFGGGGPGGMMFAGGSPDGGLAGLGGMAGGVGMMRPAVMPGGPIPLDESNRFINGIESRDITKPTTPSVQSGSAAPRQKANLGDFLSKLSSVPKAIGQGITGLNDRLKEVDQKLAENLGLRQPQPAARTASANPAFGVAAKTLQPAVQPRASVARVSTPAAAPKPRTAAGGVTTNERQPNVFEFLR
jgi:AraC-like DNA-binding protein